MYNISNSTESCQDSNSSISITDNIDNTGSPSSKVHSEILDRVGHKPLNSPTLEEPVFMSFEAQDIDFADSDPDYNPDIYMKDLAVSTPQSVELKTPNEDKTSEGLERSEYDLGIEWDDERLWERRLFREVIENKKERHKVLLHIKRERQQLESKKRQIERITIPTNINPLTHVPEKAV